MLTPSTKQPQEMDESEWRTDLTDALNKAIEAFCSHTGKTYNEIISKVLHPIVGAMDISKVFVDRMVEKDKEKYLTRVYRWNKPGDTIAIDDEKFPHKNPTVTQWVEILRQGTCINKRLSEMSGEEEVFMCKLDLKSIIIVPVFISGEFWGNVVFQDSRNERCVDGECMELVKSFARLCANAIIRSEMETEIAKQNEINKKNRYNILRLESESEKIYYDPLTGIYNRRFFAEGLSRVMNSLSRSGGILSLMMIDIDFFKNYNDTYGHSAGDECLKMISETLSKSAARADDFVARFGGEEFAVVLPNTDEEGARMMAEKMLENIRNCNMPHVKSSIADIVTISIGVTTGKVGPKRSPDDFILRADELLYMSKQGGRNIYTFGTL